MSLTGIAALVVMLTPQTGVTPIPTSPPTTSPRSQVPSAAVPAAKPISPLLTSPQLRELDRRLAESPLTLDKAISVGFALNPSLAQAGEGLFFAEGKVKEAKSAFLPNLSAGPGGQWIDGLVTPAYYVQATMPLDISNLLSAATDQARFEELSARLEVNRVRNDVAYGVENAFYGALRAQALVSVASENLSNSEEELRDAQARYKARAVAYIDVVQAQTAVADAQRQVIQAKGTVSVALATLANQMGISITSPLSITDKGAVITPEGVEIPSGPPPILTPKQMPTPATPTIPIAAATTTPGSVQSISADLGPAFRSVLSEALRTRPELFEADANVAAAQKGVKLARRSDLPSLAMGLGYFDLRTQSGSRVNQPQAYIGINIPIFDGGLATARVQEARAQVSSAITAKREALDAVTLDVERAYIALDEARDQVAVAVQALQQAKVAFDLARVRYNTGVSTKAGISPLIEVSQAQAALTLAENNQVNALYDFNDARARLDRAVGRFAYTGH